MTRFAKSFSGLAADAFSAGPLLLYGQDTMQNSQSGMGKNPMGLHMVTVTGPEKGQRGRWVLHYGKDGAMWELSSKTVNLSEHVNHQSAFGTRNAAVASGGSEGRGEPEVGVSGSKYSDLKVAQLKMVSTSCTP